MKSAAVKMNTYLNLDVKVDTYIDLDLRKDDKDPEFNVSDHARISKYKNVFVKRYKPKSSEEVLAVKMLGRLYCGRMSLKISRVKIV